MIFFFFFFVFVEVEREKKNIEKKKKNRNRFSLFFPYRIRNERGQDGRVLAGFIFFSSLLSESKATAASRRKRDPSGAASSSAVVVGFIVVGRCSIVVIVVVVDESKEEARQARFVFAVLHEEFFFVVVVFLCFIRIDTSGRVGGLFDRVREAEEKNDNRSLICRVERIEKKKSISHSPISLIHKNKLNTASPRPRSTATGETGHEAWTTPQLARKCEQVRRKN